MVTGVSCTSGWTALTHGYTSSCTAVTEIVCDVSFLWFQNVIPTISSQTRLRLEIAVCFPPLIPGVPDPHPCGPCLTSQLMGTSSGLGFGSDTLPELSNAALAWSRGEEQKAERKF